MLAGLGDDDARAAVGAGVPAPVRQLSDGPLADVIRTNHVARKEWSFPSGADRANYGAVIELGSPIGTPALDDRDCLGVQELLPEIGNFLGAVAVYGYLPRLAVDAEPLVASGCGERQEEGRPRRSGTWRCTCLFGGFLAVVNSEAVVGTFSPSSSNAALL